MFKRTAVPPLGPSEHQARQPLNMALGLSIAKSGECVISAKALAACLAAGS
jgi:hypothetical protein